MKIEVPDETVKELQAMLATMGEEPDVEAYVHRTLAKQLFLVGVDQIHRRTADIPIEQIEADVEAAVKEVRDGRRARETDAGRS